MNVETTNCYNNIGGSCEDIGNLELALSNYEKGLNITLKILGEMNVETANCYNNIGGVYDSKGHY